MEASEIIEKQLPNLPEEKNLWGNDEDSTTDDSHLKNIHSKFAHLNLKENYLGQVPEVPKRDRDRGPRRVNGLQVGNITGEGEERPHRRSSESSESKSAKLGGISGSRSSTNVNPSDSKLSRTRSVESTTLKTSIGPSTESSKSSLTRRPSDNVTYLSSRRPSESSISRHTSDSMSASKRRPSDISLVRQISGDSAYSMTRRPSGDASSAISSRRPSTGSIRSQISQHSSASSSAEPPRRRASDTSSSRPQASKRHSAPSTRRLSSTSTSPTMTPRRMSSTSTYSNEQADSVAAAAVVAQEMSNVQALKRLSLGALPTLDPDLPQFSSFYNEANPPNMNRRSLGNGTPPVPVVVPSGANNHGGSSSSSSSSASSRQNTPSPVPGNAKVSDDGQTATSSSPTSSPVGRSYSSGSAYRISTPPTGSPRRTRSSGQQPLHVVTEFSNEESSGNAENGPISPGSIISSQHASQLLWVPANVHPELAPQEWKSFVQQKVAEIRATISPQQSPSSLSNEASDSDSQNEPVSPSSGAKLSRRNTRLSREISDQAEYTDGSDVLENKRKSRGASLSSPEDMTSLSSLSAQLKSLGELESLAMDPFQLARSLSRTNTYGYGSNYSNNAYISDDSSNDNSVSNSDHDRKSSSGSMEIEPLANDSDQPIMSAPSPSLRRAAHTRYNKPAMRKGRQRGASLKKEAEDDSNKESQQQQEQSQSIKPQQQDESGQENNASEIVVPVGEPIVPLSNDKVDLQEKADVPAEEPISRQTEGQFGHVEPLVIARSRELSVEAIPSSSPSEDPTIIPSTIHKSELSTGTSAKSSPAEEVAKDIDDDLSSNEVVTDKDLPPNPSEISSKLMTPSMLGASTDVLSAIPIANSSFSGDDSSISPSVSPSTTAATNPSTLASPGKQKQRKNSWRWLFNGNANGSDSGKISEQVITAAERGSSDEQSPVSPVSATSAVFDRKGISSFFSKMKVRKDSDEQSSPSDSGANEGNNNSGSNSLLKTISKPTVAQEVKERQSRGHLSPEKKKGVTKSRYRSRSRSRARQAETRKQRDSSKPNEKSQQEIEAQQRELELQLQQQQQQMKQFDGGLPYHIPAHQMSDKSMVMMHHRYPLHIERAIYRLSHLKLANPRRPLVQQVLLSNFMYAYLNLINHGYQQQMQQMQQMQQLQQLQLQQLEEMKHHQNHQPQDVEYIDGYRQDIVDDGYDYDYDNYRNDGYSGYEEGYGNQPQYDYDYDPAQSQGHDQVYYQDHHHQQQQYQPQHQHQQQMYQQQHYQQHQAQPHQQQHYQTYQKHQQIIYEEDISTTEVDPKKSPSGESTSSSSSSSSVDANEDLWHGEDESQAYLQENVSILILESAELTPF
ncbi:Zds1p [Sugiyamaella lignohabitans]|uniref:Zds1p n=1 Tax=Sugiyamaella lignohabitans TaxID=796027 RepID=A0A167DIA0_9ASCO|nr:Zds1p [Sugiyamaella lignohabitans]ANB12948.1 Zds1p [Sugiyamaella lignohabitans]